MRMDEKQLLELCKLAVEMGVREGADAGEAQGRASTEMQTNIELGQISSVSETSGTGIAIRLYVNQRVGCAFTNILERDAIREAVRMAITGARASTEDPDWVGLPRRPTSYPDVRGLWDNSMSEARADDIVNRMVDLLCRSESAEQKLIAAMSECGMSMSISAYANTEDITSNRRIHDVICSVTCQWWYDAWHYIV